jgi:hypothetical protein
MVAALGVLRRKSFLLSVAGAQPTPELQHTCSRLQWLASATPDPQPSRVDLSRSAVSLLMHQNPRLGCYQPTNAWIMDGSIYGRAHCLDEVNL